MNIHLCINDECGISTEQLFAIVFETPNVSIHISSNIIPDPNVICRIDVEKMQMKVSRWTYPIRGYIPYYGNILWDMVKMGEPEAWDLYLKILNMRLHDWWKFSADEYEYDEDNLNKYEEAMINLLINRQDDPDKELGGKDA